MEKVFETPTPAYTLHRHAASDRLRMAPSASSRRPQHVARVRPIIRPFDRCAAERIVNCQIFIGASGPLDSGFVEMGFLSKNANLKPGQSVKTSGKGGVFPENIPIGNIVDVHSVESGLANVARVRLAANLGNLEEVWVRFP